MSISIFRGERYLGELVAEMDEQGQVWRGEKYHNDLVGRVDAQGQVWSGEKYQDDMLGRVDDQGQVWSGSKWSNELVGRVDDAGKVWAASGYLNDLVGEVDPPSHKAGASLLLLFHDASGTTTTDPPYPEAVREHVESDAVGGPSAASALIVVAAQLLASAGESREQQLIRRSAAFRIQQEAQAIRQWQAQREAERRADTSKFVNAAVATLSTATVAVLGTLAASHSQASEDSQLGKATLAASTVSGTNLGHTLLAGWDLMMPGKEHLRQEAVIRRLAATRSGAFAVSRRSPRPRYLRAPSLNLESIYLSPSPLSSYGLVVMNREAIEANEDIRYRRFLGDDRVMYVVVPPSSGLFKKSRLSRMVAELTEPDVVIIYDEPRTTRTLNLQIEDGWAEWLAQVQSEHIQGTPGAVAAPQAGVKPGFLAKRRLRRRSTSLPDRAALLDELAMRTAQESAFFGLKKNPPEPRNLDLANALVDWTNQVVTELRQSASPPLLRIADCVDPLLDHGRGEYVDMIESLKETSLDARPEQVRMLTEATKDPASRECRLLKRLLLDGAFTQGWHIPSPEAESGE